MSKGGNEIAKLDVLDDVSVGDGEAVDGIQITAYGQGQITGLSYTIPAHGSGTVEVDAQLLCVTAQDVVNLDNFIRGLLAASEYKKYDDLATTKVSGGVSFFGMFGFGGASASYEDTKHTMEGFGLSEENQRAIVNAMMAVAQKTSEFKQTITIQNTDYDYSVSGNLYAIVMDAVITKSDGSFQKRRFVSRNTHLKSANGEVLDDVKPPLY